MCGFNMYVFFLIMLSPIRVLEIIVFLKLTWHLISLAYFSSCNKSMNMSPINIH